MFLPPLNCPDLKVIYIYGDPVVATLSLFRRKYQTTQSLLLRKYIPDNPVLDIDMTIEEYAQKKRDILHLQDHFTNWFSRFQAHQSLFLSYETLFENLEVIQNFLQVPNDFISDFPPLRERKSKLEDTTTKTVHLLCQSYEAFIEQQKAIPKPLILEKQTHYFPFRYKIYRRTLFHYLISKIELARKFKQYLHRRKK